MVIACGRSPDHAASDPSRARRRVCARARDVDCGGRAGVTTGSTAGGRGAGRQRRAVPAAKPRCRLDARAEFLVRVVRAESLLRRVHRPSPDQRPRVPRSRVECRGATRHDPHRRDWRLVRRSDPGAGRRDGHATTRAASARTLSRPAVRDDELRRVELLGGPVPDGLRFLRPRLQARLCRRARRVSQLQSHHPASAELGAAGLLRARDPSVILARLERRSRDGAAAPARGLRETRRGADRDRVPDPIDRGPPAACPLLCTCPPGCSAPACPPRRGCNIGGRPGASPNSRMSS